MVAPQKVTYPYVDAGLEYARGVVDGVFPAGNFIRLACQRQLDDLERWPDRDGPYWWDAEAADDACYFAEQMPHIKGKWARNRENIHLEPWQCFTRSTIFGWKRPDNTRRFNRAFLEVPRKNAKSTEAAVTALHLFTEGEPGSELYSAATKRDQAKIVFGLARSMCIKANGFRSEFGIDVQKHNMNIPAYDAKFEPLAADSDGLEGLNPHGAVIDELHAHKDRTVYDVLLTAFGSRDNWLLLIITTAGEYDPESIGYQEHAYAVGVLDGSMEDDSYFAFIACADKGDDPFSVDTWRKANPNYGVSVLPRYIEAQATKAKNQPSFYEAFLRYHLNLWVQAAERWIPAENWNACGGQFDLADLEGQTCYGAIDMASTADVAAIVYVFPLDWQVVCRFFVPEETIPKRSVRDRVPYSTWAEHGHITATPGNGVDYGYARSVILQDADTFDLREVWYDPWNLEQFGSELHNNYGIETAACRQGFVSMNEPCKALERLIMTGALQHGDNPVLTWMAGNAVVRLDESANIRLDKKRSREKIDGMVALAMAVGAATKGGGGAFDLYDEAEPLAIQFG